MESIYDYLWDHTPNGIPIWLPVRPNSLRHYCMIACEIPIQMDPYIFACEATLPMESIYGYLWDRTPNRISIGLSVRPSSQWNPYTFTCETTLPVESIYDCLWYRTHNGISILASVRPHHQWRSSVMHTPFSSMYVSQISLPVFISSHTLVFTERITKIVAAC